MADKLKVMDAREAATTLQPGDVMLYRPSGAFGWMIRLKTWHKISHVEVYCGDGRSFASRDGKGTDYYPVRLSELCMVRRPMLPFTLAAAETWFAAQGHQPYGWFDLLQFMGIGVDAKGIVCSPAATEFLRAGGLPIFGREPAIRIAPMQFAMDEILADLWTDEAGFAMGVGIS